MWFSEFVFDERHNLRSFMTHNVVESVQVYFGKFFQLNQLNLLRFKVEQKATHPKYSKIAS